MPEAHFFGERAALERAGVARDVHARLCCEDLEAFATDDPEFTPDNPDHLRRPKRYLIDLLRRFGRRGPRFYRETHDGALFEDLAEAFGVDNPLGEGALASATHPSDRRDLLLRNL